MTTVATGQVLLAGNPPAGLAASFAALHVVSQRAWVLRLRRTDSPLAIGVAAVLPSAHIDCVGVLIASFRSSIPSPPSPLFTLRCAPRDAQRKTRGRVDRYSFLVGILPPLLHAGLARRTDTAISRQLCWKLARWAQH